MQQIVEDLKSIPGVVGAAVYRSKHGIIHNNLPTLFKQERLQEIAKLLVKITSAGRLNFPDLAEVLLNFEESVVVCRQISNQDFLFAICDPAINMNLLTMSFNLAIDEFSNDETVAASTPPAQTNVQPAAAAPPAPPAPAATAKNTLEELSQSGPLATPLKTMQDLLSKVMGPMAMIVFEDAFQLWSRDSVPATNTLPKLLEILCLEFGDDEKAKTYRDLVRTQLSSKSKE